MTTLLWRIFGVDVAMAIGTIICYIYITKEPPVKKRVREPLHTG
jgi:chromosome condensin MukBEF MukE localization factor